jgi:hypothetical protein
LSLFLCSNVGRRALSELSAWSSLRSTSDAAPRVMLLFRFKNAFALRAMSKALLDRKIGKR